jgi:hypothetical protein
MESGEQHQREIEEFLAENKVYDIFEEMMRDLAKNMPSDPVEHLLNLLKGDKIYTKTVFAPEHIKGVNVKESN